MGVPLRRLELLVVHRLLLLGILEMRRRHLGGVSRRSALLLLHRVLVSVGVLCVRRGAYGRLSAGLSRVLLVVVRGGREGLRSVLMDVGGTHSFLVLVPGSLLCRRWGEALLICVGCCGWIARASTRRRGGGGHGSCALGTCDGSGHGERD